MTEREVLDAFWHLVSPRLPLRYGRDALYVSPEALPIVLKTLHYEVLARDAVNIDPGLRATEMRLVSR